MPHECVKCGKVYSDDSKAVLEGCGCGSRFFFYIKEEKYEQLKDKSEEVRKTLSKHEIKEMEKDVRTLLDKEGEEKHIVVLDIETIRMTKPGVYEIDVAALLEGKPIVIRVAEGKYRIDLESAFKQI